MTDIAHGHHHVQLALRVPGRQALRELFDSPEEPLWPALPLLKVHGALSAVAEHGDVCPDFVGAGAAGSRVHDTGGGKGRRELEGV